MGRFDSVFGNGISGPPEKEGAFSDLQQQIIRFATRSGPPPSLKTIESKDSKEGFSKAAVQLVREHGPQHVLKLVTLTLGHSILLEVEKGLGAGMESLVLEHSSAKIKALAEAFANQSSSSFSGEAEALSHTVSALSQGLVTGLEKAFANLPQEGKSLKGQGTILGLAECIGAAARNPLLGKVIEARWLRDVADSLTRLGMRATLLSLILNVKDCQGLCYGLTPSHFHGALNKLSVVPGVSIAQSRSGRPLSAGPAESKAAKAKELFEAYKEKPGISIILRSGVELYAKEHQNDPERFLIVAKLLEEHAPTMIDALGQVPVATVFKELSARHRNSSPLRFHILSPSQAYADLACSIAPDTMLRGLLREKDVEVFACSLVITNAHLHLERLHMATSISAEQHQAFLTGFDEGVKTLDRHNPQHLTSLRNFLQSKPDLGELLRWLEATAATGQKISEDRAALAPAPGQKRPAP